MFAATVLAILSSMEEKGTALRRWTLAWGGFDSSLMEKCAHKRPSSSWHSHPWAWLSAKLEDQTDGHRMRMQTGMAGWGPPLELCSSFNSVKKKIQSLPSNNYYIIRKKTCHFAFCLSLVSKHWDWLRACLQVPFIPIGTYNITSILLRAHHPAKSCADILTIPWSGGSCFRTKVSEDGGPDTETCPRSCVKTGRKS